MSFPLIQGSESDITNHSKILKTTLTTLFFSQILKSHSYLDASILFLLQKFSLHFAFCIPNSSVMGKGGGCVPSKNKPLPVADETPTHSAQPPSLPASHHETGPDAPPREAPANASSVPSAAKLKIFIVFYSMYGHVEGLAKRLKRGVDGVDGVQGVLYRVPETLPSGVLNQMRAPRIDQTIPEIAPADLAAADGLLFGFPTRYGSMAAQMKAFFDSTGNLWKEQKLAGKPAGFFVSTGTQGGGQETTA